MRPPLFFTQALQGLWRSKGIASTLLLPLSWLAGHYVKRKQQRYRQGTRRGASSPHPVIVVGNLYVGGTGKTPVVLALIHALQARGWRPGIISRGYGGHAGNEARTGHGQLDPREFGDEPSLIAANGNVPVAVHSVRALALHALEQHYPDVNLIIADDGLQHLALARDIEIVVQDARGLGNGRMLPAGPLREPASRLASVDYLITNLTAGQDVPAPLALATRQLTMRLHPDSVRHLISGEKLAWNDWRERYRHASLGAMAGIGHPARFFAMLQECGLDLDKTVAMPDHDPYTRSPFEQLDTDLILITAKDAVKCMHFQDERLWAVDVLPQFSESDWLDELHRKLSLIAEAKSRQPCGVE
ncbi:tetraacyldisaccharide 4'-kinase [Paralcaligenes sp. KSB-10]|uniref:tetraacyldisaccharide 4'-kinase n=1 Tax=Paralcaligenes sp. KSB-10 TaxID=2901142 RepID=UPI001E3FEA69|nr:tetraacyldisaccharide 4'-kinase [Paralcaligenes sp. KSB-10]UHL64494.1 tetraacyldisaccharide 4'-kinase [Paralcaligenes sp. KSB-10]